MAWECQRSWNGWRWTTPTWLQPSNDDAAFLQINYSYCEDACSQHITWHPYCAHCKSYGWQQCPACSAEICISQRPPAEARESCPPHKRPRHLDEDELQLDQILSFVNALNVEQVSTTASVLLEHYVGMSANTTITLSEDVEGFQTI